ncbi:hypothetical protein AALM99_05770 [Lactococcus muris]|uniref:Cell surface protein n=1 Tax=Lactococcus muris TaxID=2941330 RepID=A0ABV4D887_9LACT
MKKIRKNLWVLLLLILIPFSFMNFSVTAASYEGYGQTGFYGEYHPPKDKENTLSSAEKREAGMAKSEKIPDAGDSSNAKFIVFALLPFLLAMFLMKTLKEEQTIF